MLFSSVFSELRVKHPRNYFYQAYQGKILQILRFQTDLKLTLDPLRTNEGGSKVSFRTN